MIPTGALTTTAAKIGLGAVTGGGGGGSGDLLGLAATAAFGPLGGIATSLFGGLGGGMFDGGDSSSASVSDSGHMITDISNNSFGKGDINFSKKQSIYTALNYLAIGAIAVYVVKRVL